MSPVAERHYRVKELAYLWGLSERTIIRLFKDEPGTLKLGSARRALLSIPETVASRVHGTLSGARPDLKVGQGRKELRFG